MNIKFILTVTLVIVVSSIHQNKEDRSCWVCENLSSEMGYLDSVLQSSNQIHAEEQPVTGGGLR